MTRIAFLGLAVLLLLFAVSSQAADLPEPIVDVELETNQAIPGQFLTLRITVLVPTWMPQPVIFPRLDAPNLRVRLPERATTPTSKRIEGEEWSGVSRRYLVAPLSPGKFSLPGGTVEITYANPENTAQPVAARFFLAPTEIEGIVPEGAEGLSPFIAARSLKLTQEIPETTLDLSAGDSLRRTVTASITGASPMILPQLMVAPKINGFAAYADAPVLQEQEDRGVLSGSRQEVLTLMVQSNGSGELPPVALSWYNIDTKRIETAALDPVRVSSSGAPETGRDSVFPLNLRTVLAATGVLAGCALLITLVGPRLAQSLRDRRQRHLASRAYIQKILLTAIGNRDYTATVSALQIWQARASNVPLAKRQKVLDALRPLSAQRYGGHNTEAGKESWRTLANSVRQAQEINSADKDTAALPTLNP